MSTRYGDKRTVYDHDRVRLAGPERPVSVGEIVEFTATNIGESTIELGCGTPWTIQRRTGDSWQELIWTSTEDQANCSNPLPPDESESVRFPLERDGIEDSIGGTLDEPISAGRYRFLLLGTDPFLAVRFRVE